ncbi:unnamed protein product [Calypogeia fissa]
MAAASVAAAKVTAAASTAGSKYIANCLAASIVVPMSIKAVIELGIPDILAKAEGEKPLTAPEIMAKLPTKSTPGPNSFTNLKRLMRPLVQQGVFTETLVKESNEVAYGLTEISKFCAKDNEWSIVPFHNLVFSKELVGGLSRLHEVILDEERTPFAAEWGVTLYEYVKKHPQYAKLFDKAMTGLTQPELKDMVDKLQESGWLDGVKTFVDVGGGGKGTVVTQVVAQNPHIQGINFDLPKVIEGGQAPKLDGVEHIGGDFFKAVPSGDVMFLKYIMHNHGDEDCIKILTRCREALPNGGKAIIVENILADGDDSPKAAFNLSLDLIMLALLNGARERAEADYRKILAAAGFSKVSVIQSSTGMDLIQGVKEE